jgi:rubrerythrin
MEKQDIINAALRLEEDGRGFYLSAASTAANDVARKTFESFAKDEENHIRWLKSILGEGDDKADPAAVKAIYGALRGIFADVPEEQKGQLAATDDDIKGIGIAIGKEEESIAAYQEWADGSDDAEVKELFNVLVAAEKNHRELLNNARTYLESTGDWFMGEEQWSFDGA